MTGSYQYMPTTEYLDQLNIDNIGECCISANTDLGEFYYLWITTNFGMTKILEYGPEMDGITPTFCNCNFMMFQYSEMKIDKRIAKFVSRPGLTQIQLVDPNEIGDRLVNLMEFMKNG